MKAIIFILVAATILSACDGCSSYLRQDWCNCFCSDMYSSCRNRCNSFESLWRIVCLNKCVKHYPSCSRNCWHKQGWFRIGLIFTKERDRQTKNDPQMKFSINCHKNGSGQCCFLKGWYPSTYENPSFYNDSFYFYYFKQGWIDMTHNDWCW